MDIAREVLRLAWRFGRMDLSLRLVAPAGGPAWPVD
jgi:hypothetical protein